MNRYDLIAFDMDGTLLDGNRQIRPDSQDAIADAVSAGKTVILSTGRSPSELKDYKKELKHVRYYICESGALLLDASENRILSSVQIPEDTIRQILNLSADKNVMFYIISNGQAIISRHAACHIADYGMGHFEEFMTRICKMVDDPVADYYEHPYPIEKINIFCDTPELRESLIEAFSGLSIEMARAEVTSLELSPKGITKGAGLKKLCELLSIPLERTIAVGDADNDMDILKTAGLSVAMGNASAHIRELSDVTVSDNNHGGCAEAIHQYLLGQTSQQN